MGGVCELLRAYVCVRMNCVKIFTAKRFAEKIFTNGMHWQKFSPGENFRIYGIFCVLRSSGLQTG